MSPWIVHKVTKMGQYGCYNEFIKSRQLFTYIGFFVFIMWDLTVLVMFVYKMFQIKNNSEITIKSKKAFETVERTLKKIMIFPLSLIKLLMEIL